MFAIVLFFNIILSISYVNEQLTVKTKLANYDAVLKYVLLRP